MLKYHSQYLNIIHNLQSMKQTARKTPGAALGTCKPQIFSPGKETTSPELSSYKTRWRNHFPP